MELSTQSPCGLGFLSPADLATTKAPPAQFLLSKEYGPKAQGKRRVFLPKQELELGLGVRHVDAPVAAVPTGHCMMASRGAVMVLASQPPAGESSTQGGESRPSGAWRRVMEGGPAARALARKGMTRQLKPGVLPESGSSVGPLSGAAPSFISGPPLLVENPI